MMALALKAMASDLSKRFFFENFVRRNLAKNQIEIINEIENFAKKIMYLKKTKRSGLS